MSDDIEAKLRRAVEDYIQRAMANGLTRSEAKRLCLESCLKESDRIARERRSRFRVIK